MRKKYIFGKKLYISVLTSILVLLTTVATTFAWVGVFANSTFETFDVELKASGLEEYGIEISATGEAGSFSDSIDSMVIKRQILKNWGYVNADTFSDSEVNILFSNLNLHQCTNVPEISNNTIVKLGQFKTIENTNTNHYFKFDIYVASTRFYEKSSSSDYLLDAYIGKGLVTGRPNTFIMEGPVSFPTSFHTPLVNLPNAITPLSGGDTVKNVTVDSKSACRVAFEKYEVVEKYNPSAYNNKSPISTIIYTGDSYNYPTYDSSNNIYEFGAILKDEVNLAVQNYNLYDFKYQRNGILSVSVPSQIYNSRGVESQTADKVLSSSTNQLIDSNNIKEKIDLRSMMKISISFWIEGWDADCFNVLNRNPITLSISLGIANDEVF